MGTVWRRGLTPAIIRGFSSMGKSMALATSTGPTTHLTRERLSITKFTVRESTSGVMGESMRDTGEVIK